MLDGASSQDLDALIARLNRGDDGARREFLARAYARLQRMTASLIGRGFPALRDYHEVDSVLHEAWPRLLTALESVAPESAEAFFRLAGHKIRQVLLDLLRERRRHAGPGRHEPIDSAAQARDSDDPIRLALLTEVHGLAGGLPEPEQTVFSMHYYLGMTQGEVARVLGMHPRQVSRAWVSAAGKLGRHLGAPDAFD